MKKTLTVIFLLLVSACESSYDYRTAHPVTVENNEVTLMLETDANGNLNSSSLQKLSVNARDYINKGDGDFRVFIPFVHGSDDFAHLKAQAIAQEAEKFGVPASKIVLHLSPVDRKSIDIFKYPYVKFNIYNAKLPECGNWEAVNSNNIPLSGFGCSIQRNVGLMVANPKDLIEMRTSATRSSARGKGIIEKYEIGDETNSKAAVNASLTGSEKSE